MLTVSKFLELYFHDLHLNNNLLGSDGLSISETYNLYLQKCEIFTTKAREYKNERRRWRQSVIHSEIPGYESCECREKHVLIERDRNLEIYHKSFDVTCFNEKCDAIYNGFVGKSKRIRIIRDLSQSKLFEKEDSAVDESWFLRYQALSRFIQAIRMVILKRRLISRLNILKRLTPSIVAELEHPNVYYDEKSEDENPCKLVNPLCPAMFP